MRLGSHFLLQKSFREHHNYHEKGEPIDEALIKAIPQPILFKNKKDAFCVLISESRRLQTQYYVGVDWLVYEETAIYVEPKLNEATKQTNYLEMLFSALKHPEVADHTDNLFEIKWDKTPIEIEQHQDLLTPLLVVIYLRLVKEIVRKGLKKSYYKVEHNLYSKAKGKVMVGKTIKENLVKNKPLNTWCTFEEFGFNGLENRLLKKALVFIQRYLPTMKNLNADKYSSEVLNYINPAFENITEDVSLHDILHTKKNAFYKEYAEAIKLAKLILQRFGYNITNASTQTVSTPPFWIDMSKLFELYVFAQLKDAGKDIAFQFEGTSYGCPDYLLKSEQLVIDAKYKPRYNSEAISKEVAKDIRQLSGYARDTGVLNYLDLTENDVAPILIIYPDQDVRKRIDSQPLLLQACKSNKFAKYYKLSVDLPVI